VPCSYFFFFFCFSYSVLYFYMLPQRLYIFNLIPSAFFPFGPPILTAEVPSRIWQINIVSMPGPQLIIVAKREPVGFIGYFVGGGAMCVCVCGVDWKAVACLWRTDLRMTECLAHRLTFDPCLFAFSYIINLEWTQHISIAK